MKYQIKLAAALLLLTTSGFQLSPLHAQGTAFAYQGRVNDGTGPANGTYNLRFALFDALTVGNQVGPLVTHSPVNGSDGLFTVALDFGANFPGADRWLEIAVRTNGGGAFATLIPRQPITATPYAIRAASAASATVAAVVTGSVPANQITGALADAQLSANVALRGGGNAFTGNQTITGGNVGIGTAANPSATLNVAGAIRADYLAVDPQDGATEGGEVLLRGAAAFPDWAMDVAGSYLRFHTGGLTKLQIDPAAGMTVLGNVGIGTAANPSASLDVAGAIRADYLLLDPVDGATEGGEILLKGTAAFPDWVMDVSSSSLRFHTLGGVKLQMDPTTLTVNGNVALHPGGVLFSEAVELGDPTGFGNTPYVDFHYGVGSGQDYNTRIINNADGQLMFHRAGSGTPLAQFNSVGLTVPSLVANGNLTLNGTLGTMGNQPLEFKVNNQRGLRLEPTASTDTVNVIGGSARNFVGAGVVGATIGGGGSGNYGGYA